MDLLRAVPILTVPDVEAAVDEFSELLGLQVLMDLGWVATLGTGHAAQFSVMDVDRSAPCNPQMSIEVPDVDEAYERAHIGPRTKAVHAYRSVRSDAKLEADARKWWKTHVTGGQVLEGVKTCSELILLHDPRYHDVISEKQACVLYTYKGNGKCWAQMRRLSYRRLGKDTYDTNLVDSTYATMHVPVGDEQFDGAREYEIGCK